MSQFFLCPSGMSYVPAGVYALEPSISLSAYCVDNEPVKTAQYVEGRKTYQYELITLACGPSNPAVFAVGKSPADLKSRHDYEQLVDGEKVCGIYEHKLVYIRSTAHPDVKDEETLALKWEFPIEKTLFQEAHDHCLSQGKKLMTEAQWVQAWLWKSSLQSLKAYVLPADKVEWVGDRFQHGSVAEVAKGLNDPTGPNEGGTRVVRGTTLEKVIAHHTEERTAKSAQLGRTYIPNARHGQDPGSRSEDTLFRCASEPQSMDALFLPLKYFGFM